MNDPQQTGSPTQPNTAATAGTGTSGTQTTATTGTTGTSGTQSVQIPQEILNKFEIPEIVRQKYAELVPLIAQTESMTDDERQYWFHILPIMTDSQVERLREILLNEKRELERIDSEYQKEMKAITDKHVTEWKNFERKEQREKLKAQESHAKHKEKAEEENILNQLKQL